MDEAGGGRAQLGRAIVVGYDGSTASQAAARWAAGTAERQDRPLRMVHVLSWPILRSASGTAVVVELDTVRSAAERLLDQACRTVRTEYPGLTIQAEVVIGDAVPSLLREATDAGLVALGSHGLGEFRDLAAGSVMAHVATHASCPVVVVPAGWARQPGGQGEVVVGVDGSAHSAAGIDFAFRYAEAVGAPLTALLAWRDPKSTGPGDMLPLVYDVDALEQDSAAVLGEALAGQAVDHPDVKVTEKLVHGPAANALLDASRTAQLLVVGSRGRGVFRGLLLGSVSQTVLHHADCPVAIIPAAAIGG